MGCTGKISLIKGKKKDFTLDIDKGDDPFDLTNAVVKVCFPGESAAVELSTTDGDLVIENAALGKITGVISSAKSVGLVVGEDQAIQVEVSINGGDFEAQIVEEVLTVEESIC